jgi:hypothetical protein
VILRAANGVEIERVAYLADATWPAETDGGGYSLVRINTAANANLSGNWRASTALGGNPGTHDAAPPFTGVALADADWDSLPALVEHFLMTSDTTPNVMAVVAGRTGDGRATLTFTRRLAADDLTWGVQTSADLVHWNENATRILQTNHGNGTATETWASDAGASTRFMRLRVSKP